MALRYSVELLHTTMRGIIHFFQFDFIEEFDFVGSYLHQNRMALSS